MSGLQIVFHDALVFVAEVHLDDFFHVLVQFREPGLDVIALGPDLAVDQALLVVGEVHDACEILSKPDGIEDCEMPASPAGRS